MVIEPRGESEGDLAVALNELRDLVERATVLVEALGSRDRWMTAREAAEYLSLSYNQFRALAPSVPRHRVGYKGYRYYQPEQREWLLEQ